MLPDVIKHNQLNFDIVKRKVEVKYDAVDQEVKEIWDDKRQLPELVVHVGVHGEAKCIHLEKCATNGFCKQDFSLKTLCDPVVSLENSGKCAILETKLNIDKIVKELNENYQPMFKASCDVGSYLCGYIYLKSLDRCRERVIFIHVPPIDKPYSSEETSRALMKIIEKCLSELKV